MKQIEVPKLVKSRPDMVRSVCTELLMEENSGLIILPSYLYAGTPRLPRHPNIIIARRYVRFPKSRGYDQCLETRPQRFIRRAIEWHHLVYKNDVPKYVTILVW